MAPTTMLMFYASGGSTPEDLKNFIAENNGSGTFQALMNQMLGFKMYATEGGSGVTGVSITYNQALALLGLTPGGVDFSQFDFSQSAVEGPGDDTKKALKYKKQYELNKNIQIAETVLSEALLETTQYGQVLQYSRKALVKIYGSDDYKSLNNVYDIIVGKLDVYKKGLVKADNPAYSAIVAGIVTSLGANTLSLEIKNKYLLYQIERLDIDVYKMIFPDSHTRFGGGGAKGKW
ncbi:hypothetical protein [Chryseobacterium gwangjuense]|uniref:hypothetical protein n=1 Tax=Chryseobacterium gwangjuense TaxID=1069980 RepID=UPI001E511586|nr:hypothetical protein [Chryseobacterium gwangjuense]MCE3074664.1 hypothetical protein [Chryseobacterium gwangjuense]